ncbi:MAG: amidohydrolase family protein [Acidobacteria bacterium]|nr:amidohydrolase family protein [Acidobacteriota bacterium]
MTHLMRQTGVVVIWIMLFCAGARGQQTVTIPTELAAYPDLIVYNGKIVTMNDATLSNSTGRTVEAMAVRGDLVQFIGSSAEMLRYAGPATRKIDLNGRTVVPGLINTHSHMHDHAVSRWVRNNPVKYEAVVKRFSVGGESFAEISQGIELVIKESMAHPLPGQWAWINLPGGGSGTGIGVQYLTQDGMTRDQLNALAPEMPVFVGAHPAFLWNDAARDNFLRYYEVEPTDENEDLAITIDTTIGRSLVLDYYFDTHLDELVDTLESELQHQAAAGFTTFSSHIVGLRITPAYMQMVRQGRMPIRFAFAHRLCQQVEPDSAGCFLRVGDWAGLGDKYFWNVGLTLGGIDNGPPAICTTMEAAPEYKSQEECILQPGNPYARAVHTALSARYRYVVNHLYGDKGLDYVMDIMEQVIEENPDITLDFMRSLRVTSDHCAFYPRKDQLPRIKKLGMILSCGTSINRSAPYLKIYGKDKASQIAPIKSIIAAGVMPTAEAELRSIGGGRGQTFHAAMFGLITRKTRDGESIAPEEAIDRDTLMKMSTVWASYYVLKEKEMGTLEPGKFADFVVFNKDYFTIPQEEIPTVFPLMTAVGGKTVVLREEFANELGVPAVGPQINFVYEPLGWGED